MIFIKENLLGKSYSWNEDSNKKMLTDGFPTRNRFDRFSGDGMLRMINLFNFLVSRLTVKEGQRIENSIVKELPLQLSTELSVFNWLKGKHINNPDNKLK